MRMAIIAVSLLAAGCSSTPKVVAEKPQYCYTYQTIETENREQVNSKVRVECTDDQIERLTSKRLGLASNCGEFSYYMQIGGRNVQRKGISCQKPDGSWEIVNTIGHIVQ
jgi:hypothetical protein